MTPIKASQVRTGDLLKDKQDGNRFVVLCNCPSSEPRRHTQRYIIENPDEFEKVTE